MSGEMTDQTPPEQNPTVDRIRWFIGIITLHRKIVVRVFLAVFAAFFLYAFLAPKYYASTGTIMSQTDTALSSIAGMSNPTGFSPLPMLGLGGSTLDYKLLNTLRSGDLSEAVIKNSGFLQYFYKRHWDASAKAWKGGFQPDMEKATLAFTKQVFSAYYDEELKSITFRAEIDDPVLAEKIASATLEQLQVLLSRGAATPARKTREFLEKRLEEVGSDLKKAGNILKQFQIDNQIYDPEKQVEGALEILTSLEAELMANQIKLGILSKYAQKSNPKVKSAQDSIDEISSKIEKIKNGQTPEEEAKDLVPNLHKAPELIQQFMDYKRQMMILDKLFSLLTAEFEYAKIKEVKDDLSFVIIDSPKVPDRKSRPKRLLVLVAGFFMGLIASFSTAVVLEYHPAVRSFIKKSIRRE
jgi:tyrosine-protein kinase Etk/Wzc